MCHTNSGEAWAARVNLTELLARSRSFKSGTRLNVTCITSDQFATTVIIFLIHLPCSLDSSSSRTLRLIAEAVYRERLRQVDAASSLWNSGGELHLSHDYLSVRCEVEVPHDYVTHSLAALLEVLSTPVSAAEVEASRDLLRRQPPRPSDRLRYALQGALFPDEPRLARPPGDRDIIRSREVARIISDAKVSLVGVGAFTPDEIKAVGLDLEDCAPRLPRVRTEFRSLPDPTGPRMYTVAASSGEQQSRLLAAVRLPGPTDAEWPCTMLVQALLGSGTSGRVNTALRDLYTTSYGANVGLAFLGNNSALVTEIRFDWSASEAVSRALHAGLYSSDMFSYWVEFGRDAALSQFEMLAYLPGRIADAVANAIDRTGSADCLASLPSSLAEVSEGDVQQYCSRYLIPSRVLIGIESDARRPQLPGMSQSSS